MTMENPFMSSIRLKKQDQFRDSTQMPIHRFGKVPTANL